MTWESKAGATASAPIRLVEVEKRYETARGAFVLFRQLSFQVNAGEMVAITGASGAGKSTLLHLIAALDLPTSGEVYVGRACVNRLTARQQADFRNQEIGYVWQSHDLLPEFTAEENVAMPLLARGLPRAQALEQASHWLNEVELSDRREHRSGELSGGEQQRVCLARALASEPAVLLADEPTGNLDNRTAEVIFALLQRVHHVHRLTTVLVTHNADFARRCNRALVLHDGAFVDGAAEA